MWFYFDLLFWSERPYKKLHIEIRIGFRTLNYRVRNANYIKNPNENRLVTENHYRLTAFFTREQKRTSSCGINKMLSIAPTESIQKMIDSLVSFSHCEWLSYLDRIKF